MKSLLYIIVITVGLLDVSQHTFKNLIKEQNQNAEGLSDALSGKFLVGAALNKNQIEGKIPGDINVVKANFNAIVAENCMKSGNLVPTQGNYDFTVADKFVAFGEENNMVVHGHTLIWHSQTPKWFFKDSLGQEVTREELISRMENHINTVVKRYKGRIKTWDVVNEAVLDDGSLRQSEFYKIIGEDFIKLAFEFAHKADPEAELYYNDYSTSNSKKRAGIVRMLQDLKDSGTPVDGMGMQGHIDLKNPKIEEFEKSIIAFSDLGLKVAITEFDITVLPSPWENQGAEVSTNFKYQDKMNPYAKGLPDTVAAKFNERCLDYFKLFLKHQDKIDKVTMWGVNDGNSWKNNWPIRGRTDYPLIFDRNNNPKAVIDSIIQIAR
ncbi:endo-1,4-beta-xylanase [Flavimarina sp. Hel_I_48]|uniref:endo-1,4-beta-xylanase n=1 Tax=Flavimarina sp. Hel_I_48 TaxID=1392488 RepID=UPI00056BB490|nr:endo-1,4-beta-xylanase [Flavimarina sp. Hel_I_48]